MVQREGITAKVRRMTPTRYTVNEAARLVGRSADTLTRWRKDGSYQPSDHMMAGQTKVYLYTDADIETLKRISKEKRPGRKSKSALAAVTDGK